MMIDGRKAVAGDIVDVKGWLHAKKLANNRYIEFIEESETVVKESKPKAVKKEKVAAE